MSEKRPKNANYDFAVQKQPKKPMGSGSFANMPEQPIMANYGPPSYRDGVPNNFACYIDETSGIHENER